jgi:hypothetical protein
LEKVKEKFVSDRFSIIFELKIVIYMKKGFLVLVIGLVSMSTFVSCEKSSTSTNCDPSCNSVQCSSNTQQGVRCQNTTKNCCGRCYQHK